MFIAATTLKLCCKLLTCWWLNWFACFYDNRIRRTIHRWDHRKIRKYAEPRYFTHYLEINFFRKYKILHFSDAYFDCVRKFNLIENFRNLRLTYTQLKMPNSTFPGQNVILLQNSEINGFPEFSCTLWELSLGMLVRSVVLNISS